MVFVGAQVIGAPLAPMVRRQPVVLRAGCNEGLAPTSGRDGLDSTSADACPYDGTVTEDDGRSRPGPRELMHGLGLYVDGPTRWGRPLPSRSAGIFIVELPGGADEPPIDYNAVRRWVERVPGMTIDGAPATPQDLAARLRSFWLPTEPVLYVGRSAKTIGGRMAAITATTLGDARPSSAANWLKALSGEGELRVWWAETDAHEEYEDALLSEVMARNGGRLPFGNPAAPSGERRDDGIRGALIAEDTSPLPAPRSKGARAGGSAKAPTRSRAKPASGMGSTARRAKVGGSTKPSAAPTQLTADGLEKLTAELEQLRTVTRPEVIARVAAARALGDLRENADYEYARKEQSFVEGRIQALEQMLRHAVVFEARAQSDTAHLGSTVVVESGGDEATYLLVGPTEADPAAGRISNVSPVGRALIGARAGDEVSVSLPVGTVRYRVREVR
jgi:transcription elongation factor GreA